jgi:hypothetical protein
VNDIRFLEEIKKRTRYYEERDLMMKNRVGFFNYMNEQLDRAKIEERPKSPEEAVVRGRDRYVKLFENFKLSLHNQSRFPLNNFYVENLPNIGFTGMALIGPNQDRFIFIDSSLNFTLTQIGTLLFDALFFYNERVSKAKGLNSSDYEQLLYRLWGINRICKRFVEKKHNREVDITFMLDTILPMSSSGEAFIPGTKLADVMNCFIISHELAHHFLGHTSKKNDFVTEDGEIDYNAFKKIKEEELEADRLGLEITYLCGENHLSYNPFYEINYFGFAPLLMFKIFEIVESFGDNASNDGLSTHPTAIKRFQNLKGAVDKRFMKHQNYQLFEFLVKLMDTAKSKN